MDPVGLCLGLIRTWRWRHLWNREMLDHHANEG